MLALYIVVGILTLFFISLSIPMDVIVDFKTDDEAPAMVTLRWLFGLVKIRLDSKRLRISRQRIQKRGLARIRRMSIDFRSLSSGIKLARRLLRTLKIKSLSGYIKLGFSNPVETAIAFALIQPLAAVISLLPRTDLKIEPVFSSSSLEAQMEGDVRFLPFRPLITVFRFVLSRDGWYLIRYIIRTRRR